MDLATTAYIEKEKAFCAQNYAPLEVVLSKGEGVWVWDISGKKYLDMMSAYSAVSHGHTHPALLNTLMEQAKKLVITSRAFYCEHLAPFLEKLCGVSGMDQALPMNTGAEAVETAIKAARRWGMTCKGIAPDQGEIIVARNNFHGRTVTITSFSSEPMYKEGFGPFTPGFKEIPFGEANALEEAINSQTCAFLVEPMQGEAGIQMPPVGWLKQAQQICQQHNVLFILDEIQTGLGRTGKMFAFEHEQVKPDGLILGKALGGGMFPVSAFLAKKEVMDSFIPGNHGSTFGGNPLACAVGLKALEVLQEERLCENSAHLGQYLQDKLTELHAPVVKEVRGKGLWIGIEIKEAVPARTICQSLLAKGILCKEVHDTVVRLAPPLIITQAEIDWAFEKIASVLTKAG